MEMKSWYSIFIHLWRLFRLSNDDQHC